MPIIFVIAMVVLALVTVELGLIASPFSKIKIEMASGKIRIARGMLSARAMEFLADIVREEGVGSGFITVSRSGKTRFSTDVPRSIRQRIRNVLAI